MYAVRPSSYGMQATGKLSGVVDNLRLSTSVTQMSQRESITEHGSWLDMIPTVQLVGKRLEVNCLIENVNATVAQGLLI